MNFISRSGSNNIFIIALLFIHINVSVYAQCPPVIDVTNNNASITIDDFGDLMGGVIISGATNIYVDAGCVWDLYARLNPTPLTYPPVPAYSTQGVTLPLTAIEIRAFNACETPNHDWDGDLITPDAAPRISSDFGASFNIAGDNYIVGTAADDANPVLKAVDAPCIGTAINDAGDQNANPTTHRFRIDFRITPRVIPIITPGVYTINVEFYAEEDGNPGNNSMESFTLQVEILPVLQLKMTTPSQIDFVFSDIKQYNAGIVKYGATIIEVNSSLNWDLMAVGTSSNIGILGPYWDNPVDYSSSVSSSNLIPLEVLEIHQWPVNPAGTGAGVDYSPAFSSTPVVYDDDPNNGVTGNNNIEVAAPPFAIADFAATTGGGKTLAGDWGLTGGADFCTPGSYIAIDPGWNVDNFRYVIDYRIVPNLPVDFFGIMPVGMYARPGAYTMEVKFILSEDQ